MKTSWLLAVWFLACAPSRPAGYVHARDAAESSYATGHFADAGRHWLDAATSANTARDRSEARYRAATSYQRAGQIEQARALYQQIAAGKSDRAARATFALADLRLLADDQAGANVELEAAIVKFPSSGVANLALRRYFAALAEHGGDQAVLEYLTRVEPKLDRTDLAEQLLYERARRLDAQGKTAQARDAYVVVADRFAYPYGAYWDDALFRGAECEVRLAEPARAIALLKRMLAARETSYLSGSYERPRFADAAYRVAELYRDQEHDLEAARRAFRDVFVNYPNSTLRDDALWQEALLRRASTTACAPLALLVQEFPDSRYTPCAHKLCTALSPMPERTCAAYIERTMEAVGVESKPNSAD